MTDNLQFERAQFASGNHCTQCQTPLRESYYRLIEDTVCPFCAEKARAEYQQQISSSGGFGRAVFFGAAAAIGGSVIYGGVAVISGRPWNIIAIFIGWMVATAMMKGSDGIGGRRFQVVALLLTYFSITSGYVPVIMNSMVRNGSLQRVLTAPRPRPTGIAPSTRITPTASAVDNTALTMRSFVVLVVSFFLAATIPIRLIASIPGVFSTFMIALALQRAWIGTAGTPFSLFGPFRYTPPEEAGVLPSYPA
jgi:hypothetical protein